MTAVTKLVLIKLPEHLRPRYITRVGSDDPRSVLSYPRSHMSVPEMSAINEVFARDYLEIHAAGRQNIETAGY